MFIYNKDKFVLTLWGKFVVTIRRAYTRVTVSSLESPWQTSFFSD